MSSRYPRAIPAVWLMTDDRMGEALWAALNALPRGAGVVFRHYTLDLAARKALFAKIARVAHKRRLVLVRAGPDRLARHEAGIHGRQRRVTRGLHTWPAHSRREAIAGVRAGADLLFVSPIFATRSHPKTRALGPNGAARIVRGLDVPAIALGGMTPARAILLTQRGFAGWAAIDAWLAADPSDQKCSAVPI